jgi:hypothetical protein
MTSHRVSLRIDVANVYIQNDSEHGWQKAEECHKTALDYSFGIGTQSLELLVR